MKQHITVEQSRELSEKGQNKFSDWLINETDWAPTIKVEPLVKQADGGYSIVKKMTTGEQHITIGRMIEFLGEKLVGFWRGEGRKGWEVDVGMTTYKADVLCDALWKAVKKVLEK